MNWYKTAIRSNIERMNDPFDKPYERQNQPPVPVQGDPDGIKLTTPFDETYNGSMGGTRFRGPGGPRNWSSKSEEYNQQLKNELPTSTHSLISNDPNNQDYTMRGNGVGAGGQDSRFSSPEDIPEPDSRTFGPDPVGPSNMTNDTEANKSRMSLFQKVKNRLSGTYNNN